LAPVPHASAITTEHLTSALAPHYRIERELGAGGAATVHLAEDIKHGRRVAIKVLRRDLLATTGADRFVREIRVAARLTHPNIVPLLDSGQANDTPYYVMPYIEGETLRSRMTRERTLPIAEAITLATEVADALEYAHAAGIVHRDIKPENILLMRGHAIVADFGIARALTEAVGDNHTSVGLIMGTPTYMSPEQASGEPDVDGRSDVYALATVLFEMIGGSAPFHAPTIQGMITKRFTEVAPRLSTLVAGIPPSLDDALAAALSRDPIDRPASALQFARAITAMPGDAALSPAGVAQASVSFPRPAGAPPSALPSVAVLPFANLSGDPANEFLSDGITEEIMSTLSRLRTIRVAARASSFAFKERREDVREIAGKLGVGHVLDGSVRRAGTRIRVTAQLVDAKTGFETWSDRLDREFDDAFAIQDEIARAIAAALSATLLPDAGVTSGDVIGGAAYELYLRGRFALNKRTEADLLAASRFFTDAVERQPDLAVAHAGLADAQLLLGVYGAAPATETMPRARVAAQHALALDPALGAAHATLGSVRALHDWDWIGAEDAFRRAMALDPRYPSAWQWRAMNLLIPRGRFDEARNAMDRARALDPLSMVMATSTGVVYHLAGDTAGAVRALERALEMAPYFPMTHFFLGGALRDGGDLPAAAEAFGRAIATTGGTPEMTAGLAQVVAKQGDLDGARAMLEDLTAAAKTRHVSHCLIAQVQVALGDLDAAEESLERAAAQLDAELPFIGARPVYRVLRGRPRFDDLRARVGV
jgi:serine/threonine protein kinase/tetratricopeptide (TPR) repeat protein